MKEESMTKQEIEDLAKTHAKSLEENKQDEKK